MIGGLQGLLARIEPARELAAAEGNVLEHLQQAAELAAADPAQAGLTAERYARWIEDLQAVREDVRAVETQQQASERVEGRPAEAGRPGRRQRSALASRDLFSYRLSAR